MSSASIISEAEAIPGRHTGEAILLVDDNAINLKLMRVTLDGLGYVLSTATSAESALGLLGTLRPRLILLDIQLPGMSGLDLARRLKGDQATRHIKVVAVTAYASLTDEARAFDAGCDGFIRKPIDTRTLPDVVAAFLRAPDEPRGTPGPAPGGTRP